MSKLQLLCVIASAWLAPPLSRASDSHPESTPVLWATPTNEWPSSIWIYKVVRQDFPPAAISNLLEMASFRMSERTNFPSNLATQEEGDLFFTTKDRRRHLSVVPSRGFVQYSDLDAEAPMLDHPQGVPSEDEAYRLALEWLRRLGIDRSQLSTKPGTDQLRIFREVRRHQWTDQKTGRELDEISNRSVDFIRRVDGIEIEGIGPRGGVCIDFGNHGKVCQVEICWRGLEPFKLANTLLAEQIRDLIRRGSVTWNPWKGVTGLNKITVTAVVPTYRGEAYAERQDFMEPYAVVYASLDYGTTNISASCHCPIITGPSLLPHH
jgi:hypothetical protein